MHGVLVLVLLACLYIGGIALAVKALFWVQRVNRHLRDSAHKHSAALVEKQQHTQSSRGH